MKQVLLTGDRPTGPLHLGHLVGSLQNRVRLQSQYQSFVLIADTQALTDNYERPGEVKNHVLDLMADYLAVGLDPQQTHICLQSQLTGLFELTQYLSNLVSFDALKHNPTLKTELQQKKINTMGFINYPISQAADILGFRAQIVPVGKDQSPILDLTNRIRRRFNHLYGREFFPEVTGIYSEVCSSLRGIDGQQKMSKSLKNAIFLQDELPVIRKKVYQMFTDPLHVRVEDPGHLAGNVVVYYLDLFDPETTELAQLKAAYERGGVADIVLKDRLVAVLEALIQPIRERRQALRAQPEYLKSVLAAGTEAANRQVNQTVAEVREIFSLNLKEGG